MLMIISGTDGGPVLLMVESKMVGTLCQLNVLLSPQLQDLLQPLSPKRLENPRRRLAL